MTQQDYNRALTRLLAYYDSGTATGWLKTPKKSLNGRAPMNCNYSEVIPLLSKIEAGEVVE